MTLWDVVVLEGEYSIDKAEEALRNSFAFSKERARTIARTEMISAARAGQFYGDKQSGIVVGKEWFAAHQDRTRPWHLEADGQRRPLDEPFEVNGEKLMFPGDTSLGATADNIVNCRCGYFRIWRGKRKG
nr:MULTISPECIES: phage minor head protein [unclassified Thermoactinomyces]